MTLETEMVQRHLDVVWKGWKIARKLGNGTYGTVYEIYRDDPETRITGKTLSCALKVLYMESGVQENLERTPFIYERDNRQNAQGSLFNRESSNMETGQDWRGYEQRKTLKLSLEQPDLNGLQEDFRFNYSVSDSMIDDFVDTVGSEIRMMIDLKGHPNIVSIEDYHISRDDRSCIIMIRMEKLDCLSKAVREGTQMLRRDEILQLGIDICTALEFCEKKGIIHRDIKPSNLFFSDKTGFKLGDFGISRTMDHIYMATFMSGVGTPQYVSPEVYYGRSYNNQVDIFSLGMVLYMLLNESYMPFLRDDLELQPQGTEARRVALMRRMSGEKLPAPINADPQLSSVILKACAYNPLDRFTTATEFKEALQGCFKRAKSKKSPAVKTYANDLQVGKKQGYRTVSSGVKITTGIVAAFILFFMGIMIGNRLGYKEEEKPDVSLSGEAVSDETPTVSVAVETAENNTTANQAIEESVDLDENLEFADTALEKAIRTYLGLEEDQTLTKRAALQIEVLDLGGGGKEDRDKIHDLTGLSAFENLKELYMPTNKISNIDELAHMKNLQKIMLEANQISDLSPLQNLDQLRKLELADNEIYDLEPLFSLNKLEILDVNENHITSIKGIGSMRKLNTLRISSNQITDISPLGELRDLTHLSFGHNQVEDISVLYDLPMLKVLTMNENEVRDIDPVLYMDELYWLEVAGNPIEDESVFDKLPKSVKHLER